MIFRHSFGDLVDKLAGSNGNPPCLNTRTESSESPKCHSMFQAVNLDYWMVICACLKIKGPQFTLWPGLGGHLDLRSLGTAVFLLGNTGSNMVLHCIHPPCWT